MPGRAPRDSANMIGHATEDTTVTGFAEYERYDGTGLAELVRRRQVSPSELLEAAIAGRGAQPRGQRRDDAALRLRTRRDQQGAARRPVHGRAVSHERCVGGDRRCPDDPELTLLRRRAGARGRQRARRAAQAGRARDLRPHEHVRARAVPHLRAAPARADAQPLGPHAHLRRLERRRRGSRRGAHAPDGACDGRLRLDPRAGRVLRSGGPQATRGRTRWRRGSARGSAAARSSTR